MPSPLEAAGAAREPSEYAALVMDRAITGLWTQRSPLRDANVPYLYEKFYSAGRFDSMIDGLNREISAALTWKRAPGSSVYNSMTFPACNSFYSWKFIQNNAEILRVLYDGQDGNIYDATAGQKTILFSKTGGASAGPAYFQSVNTELFFGDGVDLKKIIRSAKTWQANTQYTVGDFIIDGNGNIQSFQSQYASFTITNLYLQAVKVSNYAAAIQGFLIVTLSATAPTQIPSNTAIYFTGVTGSLYTTLLNSKYFMSSNVAQGWGLNLTSKQIAIPIYSNIAGIASQASAGTMYIYGLQYDVNGNALTGTSGATTPSFSATHGAVTTDGTYNTGVFWQCYGSPVQNWAVPAPTTALTPAPPTIATQPTTPYAAMGVPYIDYWAPNQSYTVPSTGTGNAIIDSNGSYQVAYVFGGGVLTTGDNQPNWQTTLGAYTPDVAGQWLNVGTPSEWIPSFQYGAQNAVCIVDTNGNLQWTQDKYQTQTIWTAGVANTSGNTQTTGSGPTWNQTLGGSTVDGAYTWINAGPASQLSAGEYQYSYSYHSIDGSVTTAAPLYYIANKALGVAGLYMAILQIPQSADPQVDQIYIWRTAGGQATLLFLDQIPNNNNHAANLSPPYWPYIYVDTIPDTSTVGQQALNIEIQAPIAHYADPPTAGMIAFAFHMSRIWGVVGNQVYYSAAPDQAIAGNSYTQWPANNYIPFPEQIIKVRAITLGNGGLIAYGTTNVYVILGTGTSGNPFYATVYMANLGLLGYWAEDVVGTTPWIFTSKNKFVSMDPGGGYKEYGYPIGDQFLNVTTGGANTGAIYSATGTFVSWHEQSSGDTGVYVADGHYGWFRLSPVSSPEEGFVWSPRRIIQGGTSAVQSIEVSPGITRLLIAPASSGPILQRDPTVSADNGQSFPSYMTLGNIVLAQTGEVAEIAHIALKSKAITGAARPLVSLLLGEIAESTATPFDQLQISGNDPTDLPASLTIWSDRYVALQNGVTPKCDNFQLKIDYGQQAFPDETYNFSIYGAKHSERRQQ